MIHLIKHHGTLNTNNPENNAKTIQLTFANKLIELAILPAVSNNFWVTTSFPSFHPIKVFLPANKI